MVKIVNWTAVILECLAASSVFHSFQSKKEENEDALMKEIGIKIMRMMRHVLGIGTICLYRAHLPHQDPGPGLQLLGMVYIKIIIILVS